RCLSTFFLQCRIFGVPSIEEMAQPSALGEILVEVMTDERHGISEDARMVRKVVEILTMIVQFDSYALESKHSICDTVVEMYSDEKFKGDIDFLYSSVQFMLACAARDDIARRSLCSVLSKVDAVAQNFAHTPRILTLMLSYFVEATPFAHKLDMAGELLF